MSLDICNDLLGNLIYAIIKSFIVGVGCAAYWLAPD